MLSNCARSSTDRASDFGSEGWGFESLRARANSRWYSQSMFSAKKLLIVSGTLYLLINVFFIGHSGGVPFIAADGVNYQQSLVSLNKDGLFSKYPGLFFQPAGYPLLIWSFTFFGLLPLAPTLISVQAGMHVISTLRLRQAILNSKWSLLANLVYLLVLLNPVLIMSTLNLGYESIAASLFALLLSECIKMEKRAENSIFLIRISLIVGILTFLNVRFVLLFLIVFIFRKKRWARKSKSRDARILVFAVSITFLPIALLSLRNTIAVGVHGPSTNLGVTLNWGAGIGATGAHNIRGTFGIPCPKLTGNQNAVGENEIRAIFFNVTEGNPPSRISRSDAYLRDCVLRWYVDNPKEMIRLLSAKALFYFSPYTGPLSHGTMTINNPLSRELDRKMEGISSPSIDVGVRLLYSMWSIALLLLTLFGLYKIYLRQSDVGLALFFVVFLQAAISIITIGDNRFRIPTTSLIIFISVIAIANLTSLYSSRKA